MGAMGGACERPLRFWETLGLQRQCRRIEMVILHLNAGRPDLLHSDGTVHWQQGGHRGAGDFNGLQLAYVRGATLPAALHQSTQGRQCLLGLRLISRRGGQLRQEEDVKLHRRRNPYGALAPSALRRSDSSDAEDSELHSVHDAVHYEPIYAEGERRPPGGQADGYDQHRVHRTILRDPRRCRLHGRIFCQIGADCGVFSTQSR